MTRHRGPLAAYADERSTRKAIACCVDIATGEVLVGELIGQGAVQERAVVGETPNLAARLQSRAAPDTVVVADDTGR